MKFKDEIDFVEKVKEHTKFTETELLRIGYMKLKEGMSYRKISEEMGVYSSRISRLFNYESYRETEKAGEEKQDRKLKKRMRDKKYRDKSDIREKKKKFSKEWYKNNKNKESFKKKQLALKTIANKKSRLKTLLANEIFRIPTSESKTLWSGIGKWSRKFDECIECLSTLYKHNSRGLCIKCYRIFQRPENPSFMDYERRKSLQKEAKKRYKTKFLKAMEIIENNEIEITLKIQNILDHINN